MFNTSSPTSVVQTVAEIRDVIENLLLLLSEKEKLVIIKRFNLDGQGKATLEEIGNEFAVTRERVRQIERNALAKMRRNVFNTALQHLHSFAKDVVENSGGFVRESLIQEELLALVPKDVEVDENGLHLSLVLHESLECIGNTIDFHPYVKNKSFPDYTLKHVASSLINYLHKQGDVKPLKNAENELKAVMDELNFDDKKVKSLIRLDKRLILLENEMLGLMEWRHVYPRTLRDKISYILRNETSPLHFSVIADKISNSSFDRRSVNLQAVHNELIRCEQFVLIGRGIYAMADWGYEKGTVTDVIEKVLEDKVEMAQEDIVAAVLAQRQVKKITVLLALKNSDKFERVGRKHYKLAS